jgi:cytochrome c
MSIRNLLTGLALSAALAGPCYAAAALNEPLAGDPEHGHQIYKQICSLCHSDKKGVIVIGPPLYGAYGRHAASYPGFHYSDALKTQAQWVWDVPHLLIWEAGARKMVPGTKMSFPGLKNPKDRNDIIAYLQTLHD